MRTTTSRSLDESDHDELWFKTEILSINKFIFCILILSNSSECHTSQQSRFTPQLSHLLLFHIDSNFICLNTLALFNDLSRTHTVRYINTHKLLDI